MTSYPTVPVPLCSLGLVPGHAGTKTLQRVGSGNMPSAAHNAVIPSLPSNHGKQSIRTLFSLVGYPRGRNRSTNMDPIMYLVQSFIMLKLTLVHLMLEYVQSISRVCQNKEESQETMNTLFCEAFE